MGFVFLQNDPNTEAVSFEFLVMCNSKLGEILRGSIFKKIKMAALIFLIEKTINPILLLNPVTFFFTFISNQKSSNLRQRKATATCQN